MQAAADEPRLLVRGVDRLPEEAQLVGERRVVRADGRDEILREELQLEPAVAADDPEAASLPRGRRDRLVPVDLDPERPRRQREAVRPEDERDGHARKAFGPMLEQPFCIGGGEASDVDACDPRAVRQLARRPREDETEDDRDRRSQNCEHRQARPEARTRGGAGGADCRGRCHEARHGSGAPRR